VGGGILKEGVSHSKYEMGAAQTSDLFYVIYKALPSYGALELASKRTTLEIRMFTIKTTYCYNILLRQF
jgi:hypothetical protein